MDACELKIVFDRPDRTYAGGEQVTGTVEVHADAEVTCEALRLTWGWRTHGRGNEDRGRRSTVRLPGGTSRPGSPILHPFVVDVPNGPFTYHGHHFNVDWYLKAVADLEAWDTTAEEEFVGAWDTTAEEELVLDPGNGQPDLGPRYKPPTSDSLISHPVRETLSLLLGGLAALVLTGAVAFSGATASWGSNPPTVLLAVAFAIGGTVVGGSLMYWGIGSLLLWRTLGAVEVQFDSRTGRRGDALRLVVRFVPRRAVLLTRATARLVGRERVIKGSGDQSESFTHVLHEETVPLDPGRALPPGVPVEMTGVLRIPPSAPYSFEARDNWIEWSVEIRLAVWGRPDWVGQYPIAVVP